MDNSKGEKNTGISSIGNIPEPPKEIEALLGEYQDFLGNVFARDYKNDTNMDALSIHTPKLTKDEQKYIETLTRKLHSSQGWKDYINQFKQWAFTT